MPTPLFTLRLPQETQDKIKQLALIYGSPNGRAFAREILEVTTSGDVERVKAFNMRLIRGMGEQLTLRFNASMDSAIQFEKSTDLPLLVPPEAQKPAPKPRKSAGRGKTKPKRLKA